MRTILLAICVLAGACGGAAKFTSVRATGVTAPVPLERSLFARDPNGQLTEDALQEILRSPLELDLPARVGVLPVVSAEDWRGPNPDYKRVPAGLSPFVKRLRGTEPFTLVTEVMPIPSGALGMESLREIAARYRLRYLVLYREVVRKKTRLNPWAWGYATIIGALFLPGQEQETSGFIEASLFDVKTGLLLFTTRRYVSAKRKTNVWYQDDKLEDMQTALASRFAPTLADDVRADLERFAEAVAVENQGADAPPGELGSEPELTERGGSL